MIPRIGDIISNMGNLFVEKLVDDISASRC